MASQTPKAPAKKDLVQLNVLIPRKLLRAVKIEAMDHEHSLRDWVIFKLQIKGRVVIGDFNVATEKT